ncbi:glycosyltransferase [Glycomyces harbinensis]|uniref:Vancomycin aglycone glucosyltransferase n=1 Tax=Glycomyces harbinensis TaxID=58114 RepID=A0A1G6R440_9ACTN|nr:glycosyltransferase [Glycomyces harbinensis]SDC99163.1 vancomycin aglycone glucosyltransferase [Glycomyces harbinensis]
MRVLLSSRGSRGDVEPLAALAVELQRLGAETLVLAPPDQEFVDLLGKVGVPHLPVGGSVRALVKDLRTTGKAPRTSADLRVHVDELIEAYSGPLTEAARDADAIVATGLFPGVATAQAVSEKLGLRFVKVFLQPTTLPSPAHPPHPMPGWPLPEGVTDNRVLWDHNIEVMQDLFGPSINEYRESIGLAPVDNVRDYVNNGPWLATDPVLSPWETTDDDVVQTGAWILEDDRPLSADLEAFLAAGEAPVYAGFGSIPLMAPGEAARAAVEAARAHGRRIVLLRGWADLDVIDGGDDCFVVGEVNQQALFRRSAAVLHHGGAGTTTTAAMAGVPQVVVPQIVDQPYFAGRVAALGIGAAHEGPVPTTESLTAAFATALDSATARRATEVAASMRRDGAAYAAKLLVDEIG